MLQYPCLLGTVIPHAWHSQMSAVEIVSPSLPDFTERVDVTNFENQMLLRWASHLLHKQWDPEVDVQRPASPLLMTIFKMMKSLRSLSS